MISWSLVSPPATTSHSLVFDHWQVTLPPSQDDSALSALFVVVDVLSFLGKSGPELMSMIELFRASIEPLTLSKPNSMATNTPLKVGR